MRKTILLLALSLFTVALVSSTASAQITPALFILTNVCKVTANNIGPIVAPSDATNVTTRTMFGGVFTAVTIRSMAVAAGMGYKWDIMFTNKGNATSPFTIKMQSVVSNPNPSTWDAAFQNGTRSMTVTPAAGGVITFSVCITDALPIQANGAYIRVRIVASNTSANISFANGGTNYVGDNGLAYGGTMGNNWTGVYTTQGYKCVYLQTGTSTAAGYLTLIINAPLLGITKTIQSITKAGAASAPIPGATIQYKIVVTNGGGAAAVNTRLWDTTPATALVWGKTIAMTNLVGLDTNVSGGLNPSGLVWTNGSLPFGVTGRAVVIYQVRIQ
jgi:uncharacterized repeat protein (TIGR01451 family)